MMIQKFLWKIVSLLLVILSITGMIAIQNLSSKIHPVMPEEVLEIFPLILGFVYCALVFVTSIVLFGRCLRGKYPSLVSWYVFTTSTSVIATGFGYFTGNDVVPVTIVSILGIAIFIITCLNILIRNPSKIGSRKNITSVVIGTTLTAFFVVLGLFVFPQWFDATRNFPDHNLKVTIRESVGKWFGYITNSDLEGIIIIDASYKYIGNISGIGACKNLEVVNLVGNWVDAVHPLTDITPLEDLHQLKKLNISSNGITDMTPLSKLTGLTYLDVSNNINLRDLKPLENLTNLSVLSLWGNKIHDVRPLQGLGNLKELNLHHNNITDISPLLENSGIGKGDVLDLELNPLSDTSINVYIPRLEKLGVEVHFIEF
jgi:hypothetical protein